MLNLMNQSVLVKQDHGAEGRGNIARCQRRLLLVDVERRLMEFQHYRDNGMVISSTSEISPTLVVLI
jgi:nuclear-control-of-ATPase protein 2